MRYPYMCVSVEIQKLGGIYAVQNPLFCLELVIVYKLLVTFAAFILVVQHHFQAFNTERCVQRVIIILDLITQDSRRITPNNNQQSELSQHWSHLMKRSADILSKDPILDHMTMLGVSNDRKGMKYYYLVQTHLKLHACKETKLFKISLEHYQ